MPARHDVSRRFLSTNTWRQRSEIDGISCSDDPNWSFPVFLLYTKADRIAVNLGNGQAAAVYGDGCADFADARSSHRAALSTWYGNRRDGSRQQ